MKEILIFWLIGAALVAGTETGGETAVDTEDKSGQPTAGCTGEPLACALLGATRWLLWQQEADWSWQQGTSTSSVVMAMQLANESWFLDQALETQLAVKQLEIELLAELARSAKQSNCGNESKRQTRLAKISVARLALYILALEATCHDSRDFYGNDLPEVLEHNMRHFPRDGFSNHFQYALGVLALCQSGDGLVKLKHVRNLLDGQREDGCYRFDGEGPDVASLAVMAMACANDSVPEQYRERFDHKFDKAVACIRSRQREDASIGNGISTALASQALTAAGVSPEEWRAEEALLRVLETQEEEGHFGNLGATVQILPLLARRHHGSVKEVKAVCSQQGESVGAGPDSAPGVDTPQLGPPITITISIQNSVDKSHPSVSLDVTAANGTSLFGFLLEAVEQADEGTFRFKSKMTDFGNFVTSFNGVDNNSANHWYWSILIGSERKSAQTGPDGIIPRDGVEYIFLYKAY